MQVKNTILKIFTALYIFSFYTWGASMVLSKASISISYAIMGISWLCLGNFNQKWQNSIRFKKFILPYLLIAILFLLGLLYTTDFKYAWDNIRVKIPFFVMPLIVFSGPKIPNKHVLFIVLRFVLASFSASLIGYFKNWNLLNDASFDLRKLSPFISHIQLGQAISLSVVFIYFLVQQFNHKIKYLLILPVIWFVYFATQANSLTLLLGIVGVGFILSMYYLSKKNTVWVYGFMVIFLGLIGFAGVKIKQVYDVVFIAKDVHINYPTTSVNGNPYQAITGNERENGYLVGAQIQLTELQNEWQKRSTIPLDSATNNYALHFTLIRFLTSKGLSKDSLGVSMLSDTEVAQIEKGVANVFYLQHKGFLSRIHRSFWEIQSLQNNYYESSSLSLRFVFWQNGWQIFKNNFWLGVGTGDVKLAYEQIYAQANTYQLPANNQLRAHNQFLTNYLTLGFFGGTIFILAWLYHFKNIWNHLPKLIALSIIWVINMGMFYEDLLETLSAIALVCFTTVFWLRNSQNA